MKAVILAGGYGTRISEESVVRPKPMVEIGGKPILWHIMKIYSAHGIRDFIICLGYKGYMIKEYFANYNLHMSDVTINMSENSIEVHQNYAEPWRVTLVDTGIDTQTGGRLKRIKKYIDDDLFFFTYGDGLADIDLNALLEFHRKHGRPATVTAIRTPGRWGSMTLDGDNVVGFHEKPSWDGSWVNGGFFVLSRSVFDCIENDATVWEREPLQRLAQKGDLKVYPHQGFWFAMDTLRDKQYLEDLWSANNPPWKVW